MEGRKDNTYVNKLEKEIKNMELCLTNRKKYNFKTINKRNFKIVGSIANFLIPVYIATAISVGGIKLLGGGLPFYTDQISVDATVKKYMDSNDKVYSSINYEEPEDDSYIKIVEDWHKNEEGLFEKSEKTYYFSDDYINYDKQKLAKVIDEQLSEYDGGFMDLKKSVEVLEELPSDAKESNQKPYVEACIYEIDETNKKIQDESFWRNFWFTVLDIVTAAGLGTLGCCIRKYKIKEKVRAINANYKLIDGEEADLINDKILIKKKNLDMLTKK